MTNFNLDNLSEIIDEVLTEFCVTYPIPNFDNKEQLEYLRNVLEQFGASAFTDIELMEAISLAPKKFTLEAPTKNNVDDDAKVVKQAHDKGLEGKGGNAYGPKGGDTITYRNTNGKLVPVNPPVKIGKKGQPTPKQPTAKPQLKPGVSKPPKNKVVKPGTPVNPKATAAQLKQVQQLQKAIDAKNKKTGNTKIVNNEKPVTIEITPDEKLDTNEKGAKEINPTKFKNAKKGNITKSKISQKQGIANVKKTYPSIKEHKYNYPPGVEGYLKKVMHPAAFEAMDNLIKLSKGGDFVPPISLITDQYGAGKISAQMNELCMQAVLAFPNTPQGLKARNAFIESLRANNELIKKTGGTPILDNTWIDQFEGANNAFNTAMDRKYGKGKWSVVGTTWDVRSQNEDMGINYDDKGFSTDINLQVQVNGKLENVEISCKKDWKIFLLNGGLGKAENWYYTLGPKGEKRATQLAQKVEEKTISKEEALELKALNQQALSKAPVSNKELQRDQLKSANKGAQIIESIEPKELTRIFNLYIKGDYENGVDKKGKIRPVDDAPFLKSAIECHQTHGISNREDFLNCMKTKVKDFKGGDKYYKKAVVSIGAMLSDTNTDDDVSNWYKGHMGITSKFIEKAANTIANDKEYRKMILRKLQEAIPFKSLTTGVETMQIDSMYITQEHMAELFGTNDWNDIKQYLDVQVINGEAVLTFKAHGKKPNKPFPLAKIDIREKGGGYDGNPALEVKPTKEFEDEMRRIEDKLNSGVKK
jgi:hypothetical protein